MTDQTDTPPEDDRTTGRAAVEALLADRLALAEDGVALSDTSDIAEVIRARSDRKENR